MPLSMWSGRGLFGTLKTSRQGAPASFFGWEVFTMAQDQVAKLPPTDRRQELQSLLEGILAGEDGQDKDNVYFQPPADKAMRYPAIVYNRDRALTNHANNRPYGRHMAYQVTVISSNPDSEIPGRVAALPMCEHQRFFSTAGLNHDVFTLYF